MSHSSLPLCLETASETAASDDSCSSNEAILREAGVTFDLASFTSVDGHAPLELVGVHIVSMHTHVHVLHTCI